MWSIYVSTGEQQQRHILRLLITVFYLYPTVRCRIGYSEVHSPYFYFSSSKIAGPKNAIFTFSSLPSSEFDIFSLPYLLNRNLPTLFHIKSAFYSYLRAYNISFKKKKHVIDKQSILSHIFSSAVVGKCEILAALYELFSHPGNNIL